MRRFVTRSVFLAVILALPVAQGALAEGSLETSGYVMPPRITSVEFFDLGKTDGDASPSIDTVQDVCSTAPDPVVLEKFGDTIAAFKITNPSDRAILIKSFTLSMKNSVTRRTFKSRALGPYGQIEIGPNQEATVYGLVFRASNGKKQFPLTSRDIEENSFRKVKFAMKGKMGSKTVVLNASVSLSFGNHNRCAS